MCGIVGVVGRQNDAVEKTLNILEILEYRGYDSAGLVVVAESKPLQFRKIVGRINALRMVCTQDPLEGMCCIGHTRWATHGKPALENTHPIAVGDIAVVHNGIIENFRSLKEKLIKEGYVFSGDTDTEVIAALVHSYVSQKIDYIEAISKASKVLKGIFACAIVTSLYPKLLIGVQCGLPLVIGKLEDGYCIASDSTSLSRYATSILKLHNRSIVALAADRCDVMDCDGHIYSTDKRGDFLTLSPTYTEAVSGDFESFMLKEIHEQPRIVQNLFDTFKKRIDLSYSSITTNSNVEWMRYRELCIVACGSSFYAGEIARYLIEQYARKRVTVEIASEFRSRKVLFDPHILYIFVSQSGETADTYAALEYAKAYGMQTLGLINVAESRMAELVSHLCLTYAGIERAVASTKSFIAQVMSFSLMCMEMMAHTKSSKFLEALGAINRDVYNLDGVVLRLEERIRSIAGKLYTAKCILYIGRGHCYPLAREGALKMKELAYIPSEGIAAGEMKHGSIALIDEGTYVIAIAPHNNELAKMESSMHEIQSRGGKLIAFTSDICVPNFSEICEDVVSLPVTHPLMEPVLYAIPLQMLAYYVALLRGKDVDKPRNLAKSVTVE